MAIYHHLQLAAYYVFDLRVHLKLLKSSTAELVVLSPFATFVTR